MQQPERVHQSYDHFLLTWRASALRLVSQVSGRGLICHLSIRVACNAAKGGDWQRTRELGQAGQCKRLGTRPQLLPHRL